MPILNLSCEGQEQQLVKEYLEKNVSEILTDKINNGVQIEKDGKQLINKKTLSGFMKYACEQAKAKASAGARSACVRSDTVFGWAVHYFEEDSIDETLLNQDGTEYKAAKPKPITPVPTPVKTAPTKPKEPVQFSLFDLVEEEVKEEEQETVEEITETETDEIKEEPATEEKPKGNQLYQYYMAFQKDYPEYVIAYRLGNFYEIFGENAKKVSAALDLVLTGRDCGLNERVPMVGFPYHIADNYIAKMVEKGFKVAIVESMSDIRLIPDKKEEIDRDTGEIPDERNIILEALLTLFPNEIEVRL